jgi:hypothetical protein
MNELQLDGFGYKQSFGPSQPVLAISSLGHWALAGGVTGGGVCLGVVVVDVVIVVGGRVVILPGHVEYWANHILFCYHSTQY